MGQETIEDKDIFPGEDFDLDDDKPEEGLDFGNVVEEGEEDPTPAQEDSAEDEVDDEEDSGDDVGGEDPDDGDAEDSGEDAEGEEGEEDGDEEEEPEPEPEPEDVKPKKEPFLPKSRFDEVNRRRKAAEARAEELEMQLREMQEAQEEANRPKPLQDAELKDALKAINDLMLDGQVEEATAKQAELFARMQAIQAGSTAKPKTEIDQVKLVEQLEEKIEFKHTLKEIYQKYPELDDSSEKANAEYIEEAVSMQTALMQRGYTLAEATAEAARRVAKIYDLDREPEPAQKVASKKTLEARSKKKVAMAKKAPPDVVSTKRNSESDPGEVDIRNLSYEEYEALPESVRARLRGDLV